MLGNRLAGLILALGAAASLAAQSTSLPTFWRYSHPDTKALVGVDVKRLLESPFGQRVAKEFEQAGFKAKAQAEGMEFLSGVERVLLTSPGQTSPAKGKDNAPVVVAMQGKFDLAKIRAFVKSQGAVKSWHQKVEILSPDPKSAGSAGPDFCLALVSPQTIVAGDKASVKAALDHHASADVASSTNLLYQRAAELDAVHEIWFTSEVSPAGLSDNPMAAAMLADVDGFEGGVTFRRGLGLSVHLNTATPEASQKLGTGLQALVQMAAMTGQQPGGPADLLKKLTIATESTQVKLALSFDPAELDRGIDELKVSLTRGVTEAVASARGESPARPAASVEPPPDPARPLVIKVYNAEGGARQIPLVR
jgi:hypothetical protein